MEQDKSIKKKEREYYWDQLKLVAPLKFIVTVMSSSLCFLLLSPQNDNVLVKKITSKDYTNTDSSLYDLDVTQSNLSHREFIERLVSLLESRFKSLIYDEMGK